MAGIEKRIAKDGTLSYRITLTEGLDASGKKVRHRMTYKPEPGMSAKQADKAAQKAAFQFEQQFEQGYSVDHDQRFSDYASYVLELKLNTGLKRSTYERYLTMMPRINSQIGGLYLKAIRPMHLNQLYAYLSKPGLREGNLKAVAIISVEPILKKKHLSRQQLAKDAGVSPMTITSFCRKAPIMKECAEKIAEALGRKYSDLFRTEHDMTPLSAKTILEHHRLVHTILAQAEKEMLVPYNAADKSTPPKREQPEVNYFQPDEVCDIMDALQTEPLKWQVCTHLLMITGGRRGEICGLEWSKIDFERKRLKFDSALLYSRDIGIYETSTKTRNRRYVPLPDETLSLLREYRLTQEEKRIERGDKWEDNDYILRQENGKPMHPDSITGWLRSFSERHGLPHINPHAFRHTAASVMIVEGTDIVTISKMLGHAKVSTTEDIYSHVIEESKEQAGNALANVYFRKKSN